jgi:hypothetical protein
MTILERLGAAFGILFLVGFLGLETYFQYDYWYNTRPVIQRLNEVVAKGQDGKEITRVDMYDMVATEFIKAVKGAEKK